MICITAWCGEWGDGDVTGCGCGCWPLVEYPHAQACEVTEVCCVLDDAGLSWCWVECAALVIEAEVACVVGEIGLALIAEDV